MPYERRSSLGSNKSTPTSKSTPASTTPTTSPPPIPSRPASGTKRGRPSKADLLVRAQLQQQHQHNIVQAASPSPALASSSKAAASTTSSSSSGKKTANNSKTSNTTTPVAASSSSVSTAASAPNASSSTPNANTSSVRTSSRLSGSVPSTYDSGPLLTSATPSSSTRKSLPYKSSSEKPVHKYASKYTESVFKEIVDQNGNFKRAKHPEAVKKWVSKLRSSLLKKVSMTSRHFFMSEEHDVSAIDAETAKLERYIADQCKRVQQGALSHRAQYNLPNLPDRKGQEMQAIVEGRVQSIGNKIRLISDELSTVSKNLEDRISSFEGTLNVVRNYFDTVYERANILHQQQQQQQQQQGYNEQEDGSVDISMGYSPVQESFSRAPQPMPVMRDPYQKLHDHLAQR